MPTNNLAGLHILVVEDEHLLAMQIVDEIEDHGGTVLGPVGTLEQGIDALRNLSPDACILNVNLGPNRVYELADMLIERGIPFVFASSVPRSHLPDRFAHIPLHSKPLDMLKAASSLIRSHA